MFGSVDNDYMFRLVAKKQFEEHLLQFQKLQSLGGLAAGMAHDINNLLAEIALLNSGLIDQLDRDEPIYENLDRLISLTKKDGVLTDLVFGFMQKQTIEKSPYKDSHSVCFNSNSLVP